MKIGQRRHSRQRSFYGLVFVLCLLVGLFAMAGCSGLAGRLQRDGEVTRMFTTNTVPADYRYYYNGSDQHPFAIIGLQPQYELAASQDWKRLRPNTEDFARKVAGIYVTPYGTARWIIAGALILDQNRSPIGIWYSGFAHTWIEVGPDHIVTIRPPWDRGPAY